ncbi:hypothetical protein EW145_g5293 [Phellinidium pouzarii]|uniref:Reverse transcriptase domain-containing protein n=1 Tax=Phellinidium pouzarii TaxID=167371 RepID=A0A4S4L0I3_9AGAM|nr:hypothetical protein EW145_g5293 [Phellinidium pouzarii]
MLASLSGVDELRKQYRCLVWHISKGCNILVDSESEYLTMESSDGSSLSTSPTMVDGCIEDQEEELDWAANSVVHTVNEVKPSKLPTPCELFNKNICLSPTSCPHPHICSSCRRPDHNAMQCNQEPSQGARSARNRRGLLWEDDESYSPCAQASLQADPLPSPPPVNELPRRLVNIVQKHPELFKIVTPIKVDVFEGLLASHPNKPLVKSVCRGFREGFWPFAQIPYDLTVDQSWRQRPREHGLRLEFLKSQIAKEVETGRFSVSFGKKLYSGMACMPMHVGGSKKFRLINNHSSGDYSLNSLIPENVRSVRADDICALVRVLRARCLTKKNVLLFKSDVAQAFRIIPMSPYWQALQVVRVNDKYYVDRCNTFGNAASQRLFCEFFSLVLWIAENLWGVSDILSYVDDNFSWELTSRKKYYARYGRYLPEKQVRLLELWDILGIPHESKKQVSGTILNIIGYKVDLRRMRISIPEEKMDPLITQLSGFCNPGTSQTKSLQECQKLAGSVNWAFNVNPLLRPGLDSLHQELARAKELDCNKKCIISERIKSDLAWLTNLLQRSKGLPFTKSDSWEPDDASCTIYCDASLNGFGLWSPTTNEAFYYRFAPDTYALPLSTFHAFAVVCAIFWARSRKSHSERLLIYTADRTTAEVFNSLSAPDESHDLLLLAAEVLFDGDIDLHVADVAEGENKIAYRLSRDSTSAVSQDHPNLTTAEFRIPRYIADRAPKLCVGAAVVEIPKIIKNVHFGSPKKPRKLNSKQTRAVEDNPDERESKERVSVVSKREAKQLLVKPTLINDAEDLRFLDFTALHKAGYRGAVFDKDNCLTVPHEDALVPELKEAWEKCRLTFGDENILVVSNSAGSRLDSGGIQAESVSHHLGVPVLRHNSMKPAYSCIQDIRAYFASLKCPISDNELFVVGDRIFTDVVLANRMRTSWHRMQESLNPGEARHTAARDADGPLSIFVDRVWKKEAGAMRFLEKGLTRTVERWTGMQSAFTLEQRSPFVRQNRD